MKIKKSTFLKFVNGDSDAITKVFLEYKNLMYFVISNYICNKEDANDVLNETFIKVIEHKENIKYENLKSYLCSVSKNEAINFLKKDNKIDHSFIIDEMYGENDKSNSILNELESFLTNKETIIVYYKIVFEYSWEEICQMTGIKDSTARKIYADAKEKIRKVLL